MLQLQLYLTIFCNSMDQRDVQRLFCEGIGNYGISQFVAEHNWSTMYKPPMQPKKKNPTNWHYDQKLKWKAASSITKSFLTQPIINASSNLLFSGVALPTSSIRTTHRSVTGQAENYLNFLNKEKSRGGTEQTDNDGRLSTLLRPFHPYYYQLPATIQKLRNRAEDPSDVPGNKHLSPPQAPCVPSPSVLRTGSTSTPSRFIMQETCIILIEQRNECS